MVHADRNILRMFSERLKAMYTQYLGTRLTAGWQKKSKILDIVGKLVKL